MYKYRISKYNPRYRNEEGIYMNDEWTSYSDIGTIYKGEKFTKEEYLYVEKKYCDVILKILEVSDITELYIRNLELYASIDEIKNELKLKGLILSIEDEKILMSLVDGMRVSIKELSTYITLILRESFWCTLEDKDSLIKVEFGYDYYVYISNVQIHKCIVDKYKKEHIYIESMM